MFRKQVTTSLLTALAASRGISGGIRQGNSNGSLGSSHGYGYNVGNGYTHGDSHGSHFGHGSQYTNNHIIGYDAVKPENRDDWAVVEASQIDLLPQVKDAIDSAELDRETYIDSVLEKRKNRLAQIHDDNIYKTESAFTYQEDLLEEELEDIDAAK